MARACCRAIVRPDSEIMISGPAEKGLFKKIQPKSLPLNRTASDVPLSYPLRATQPLAIFKAILLSLLVFRVLLANDIDTGDWIIISKRHGAMVFRPCVDYMKRWNPNQKHRWYIMDDETLHN